MTSRVVWSDLAESADCKSHHRYAVVCVGDGDVVSWHQTLEQAWRRMKKAEQLARETLPLMRRYSDRRFWELRRDTLRVVRLADGEVIA